MTCGLIHDHFGDNDFVDNGDISFYMKNNVQPLVACAQLLGMWMIFADSEVSQ